MGEWGEGGSGARSVRVRVEREVERLFLFRGKSRVEVVVFLGGFAQELVGFLGGTGSAKRATKRRKERTR